MDINSRRQSAQESFTCSSQSILSAMDRFVKSVNNMDSTVLVPCKLRDMNIPSPAKQSQPSSNAVSGNAVSGLSSGNKTDGQQRIPPALANTDLHSFYLMLNDVKKELLWGPGTAKAAAATMTHSSASSNVVSQTPVFGHGHGHSPRSSGLGSGSTGGSSYTSSQPSICARDLKHIRQPSDDSLGSMDSSSGTPSLSASSGHSDQDTDSEADSMLNDNSAPGNDEHTSHLAAAFRHHLQGLHTILHQLADSADFLSSRYQEEIDG